MGINIKGILKNAKKVGMVAGNVGDILGVPGLAQLDDVIAIVDKSTAEPHDKAAAKALIQSVQSTPIIAASLAEDDPRVPWFQSKRFVMTVLAMAGVITSYAVMPKESADALFPWLAGLAGVYVAGDTLRPSSNAPKE